MLRGEAVSPDDVLRTTRAADALTRRCTLTAATRRSNRRWPTICAHVVPAMTVITFLDGYRDLPPRSNPRAVLSTSCAAQVLHWAD